ncbi:aspartyl/asparaginyl beta-hydroxylase domain-containing protein [Polyangium fumosum]|uniref:Aspartyl/asparaginyl beta-hydroxylase domain-containing protein n=1 Tax=Polyangium fumosum TaxID=889272 RepID=A0A4U1IVP9_9BACT|nr:aspartyl/asparaginyl beta-hydroxylase domain-containing protein [Polyangium fumosum]TKC98582.1 aspartyl/asparaginyl beta-hydroxylase domain-containing protein [Polyangium fumosum]
MNQHTPSKKALDVQRQQRLTAAEVREGVQKALEELLARHGEQAMARVVECCEIAVGLKEPTYGHPLQRPSFIFFPGLPSKAWYAPASYEKTGRLTRALEEAFPSIRHELKALQGRSEPWAPYIDGEYALAKFHPLQQDAWASFTLRHDGQMIEATREFCPATYAVLEEIEPYLTSTGEAFFSTLRPGVSLPPHHDDSNLKLTVHLGLDIPPDCGIKVGIETRTWQEGQCLMFDDTFLHEAWNHSDRTRTCLLLDVWHPELTPQEIDAITFLSRLIGDGWGLPGADGTARATLAT